MMRQQSEGVCGDRRIRVISIGVGPQMGAFFLRRRAWPENGSEKGASAKGKNIDILRENIDT